LVSTAEAVASGAHVASGETAVPGLALVLPSTMESQSQLAWVSKMEWRLRLVSALALLSQSQLDLV
jgi:hypothetical protein